MEEMILGERELVSQLLASAEARQAGVMIGSAVRREQPLYRAAAKASGM
jgi:hypothetical protein